MKDDDERNHRPSFRDDVIEDGGSVRVPLFMMDSVQREIAGMGSFDEANHRPSYRSMFDRAAERRRTYDEYCQKLSDAWRTPVADAPLPNPDSGATRDRDAEYEAMKERLQNAWRFNHSANPSAAAAIERQGEAWRHGK